MRTFTLASLVRSRRAFTLVEVMIVVALIAMLSAIAIPNYLRARKRTQATRIYDDLRMVDSAVAQYAIEMKKEGSAPVAWPDLIPYFKTGTPLATSGGNNLLGHPFQLTTVDDGAKVAPATVAACAGSVPPDFWAPFN